MEEMNTFFGDMPWDLPDVEALDLLEENSTASAATGRQEMDEFWEDVDVDLVGLDVADEEGKVSRSDLFQPGSRGELPYFVPVTSQERCGPSPYLDSGNRKARKDSSKKAQQCLRERLNRNKQRLQEQLGTLQDKLRAKTQENTTLARKNFLLESKIRMYREESSLLKAQLREVLLRGPSRPVSPVNLRQDLGDHVHALCQMLRAPVDNAGMSFLKRLVWASTDLTIQLVLLSGHCNYDDKSSWGPDYKLGSAQVAQVAELVRKYDLEMNSILTEREELNKQCPSSSPLQCTNRQNAAIFSAMLKNNLRKELNCFVGQIPILLQDILTPVQAAHLIFYCYPSTVNPIAFAQQFSVEVIQQSPESDGVAGCTPKILPGKVIE